MRAYRVFRLCDVQMVGAKIIRVSAAGFDPNDDFCPVWRLFDMLPEGADGWRSKFGYG